MLASNMTYICQCSDTDLRLLLQMVPSATEPAQLLPAGPPLASALDGDAFAASILIEPGPVEAPEPTAEPSHLAPVASQPEQQQAAPDLQPVEAPSEDPMAGRGPPGNALTVEVAAAAEPELASDQPELPARSPSEQPAGSPDCPPAEPGTIERQGDLGQEDQPPAGVSHLDPQLAAEPDTRLGEGLMQPASPPSAPPSPPLASAPAADAIPGSAVDVSAAVPTGPPAEVLELLSGEVAGSADGDPPKASVSLLPAEAEVTVNDRTWQGADAVAEIEVDARSSAKANAGSIVSEQVSAVATLPIAVSEAQTRQPPRALNAEPLSAEHAEPLGAGPVAVKDAAALPIIAEHSQAAGQGGGAVLPRIARDGGHSPAVEIEASASLPDDRHSNAPGIYISTWLQPPVDISQYVQTLLKQCDVHNQHEPASLLSTPVSLCAVMAASSDPAVGPHPDVRQSVVLDNAGAAQPPDTVPVDGDGPSGVPALPDLNDQPT